LEGNILERLLLFYFNIAFISNHIYFLSSDLFCLFKKPKNLAGGMAVRPAAGPLSLSAYLTCIGLALKSLSALPPLIPFPAFRLVKTSPRTS
jgi:hypothetical protein